ncbi:type II secretion system protein N [Desulfocicer vacuolatum DSM 3385]|uniref:Type II secretion system protein N n=1 Tax=Desulfocicer vacuolatum DSM 3385 TaxID=1121400 RepID=A0A1W1ZFI1_9BACT|nr:type II secretion system protein GspN [Desulfocicer vacuolatum]SMC47106.1 type II secretion system protein N [Desulfocicer vacuolatum DSM 3385]
MGVKSIFLYLLYTLGAFVVFLYLLLPGERLATIMSRILNKSLEPVTISMEDIKWHLPLKLGGKGIVVSLPRDRRIFVEHLWLKPAWTTFLNESKTIDFDMDLYKGRAFGRVEFSLEPEQGLSGMPLSYIVDARFDGIHIENFQYKSPQGDITVSCLAGGQFTLSRSQDRGLGGIGEIKITNCAVDIVHEILSGMGIPGVNFETVKITYRLEDNNLEILGCRATGAEMTLTVSGTVALNAPISRSRLDLKGRVQPDAGYLAGIPNLPPMVSAFLGRFKGKGVPFKIKGTLDRPGVSL